MPGVDVDAVLKHVEDLQVDHVDLAGDGLGHRRSVEGAEP
jgi:hypothetical protein